MNANSFEKIINEAWNNKNQVNSNSDKKLLNTISETIDLLDSGKIRVAEKKNNEWHVNQWIKKAILLSFRVNKMKASKGPYSTWYDKIDGKTQGWDEKKIAAAGIDVISGEQQETLEDHLLINYARKHENLIITPHIAGCSVDSQRKSAQFALDVLNSFFYGGKYEH